MTVGWAASGWSTIFWKIFLKQKKLREADTEEKQYPPIYHSWSYINDQGMLITPWVSYLSSQILNPARLMTVGQLDGAALASSTNCWIPATGPQFTTQLVYPNTKLGKILVKQSISPRMSDEIVYENHLHLGDPPTSSTDDFPVIALGIC